MQVLHEKKTLLMPGRNFISINRSTRDLCDDMEVKEEKSSNASLLLMNPVASGDNVTTGLNSAHKLKEELPQLVPCCEGRELLINEELVRSGLSAISVKHDSVIQCLSMSRACEKMQIPPGLVKHRNSFRSLHRPDLKRVPYLRRMTPDELETLFRGYSVSPARGNTKTETREELLIIQLPPDESGCPGPELKGKQTSGEDGISLRPIQERTDSRIEDVPVGMRLHGARARLYTSVLAGAKYGDQADSSASQEEHDPRVPFDPVPDDEVPLREELQIILPPRYDDVTAHSSVTVSNEQSFLKS